MPLRYFVRFLLMPVLLTAFGEEMSHFRGTIQLITCHPILEQTLLNQSNRIDKSINVAQRTLGPQRRELSENRSWKVAPHTYIGCNTTPLKEGMLYHLD